MKKILAMVLCVVMVMSLAAVTFAAETETITYDFANLEVGKEEIVDNALDVFNAATTDTQLVSVTTSKVYPGNADGGCHKGENGYLKTGTSKVPGQIVLTYGEGVKVVKVEIVCHDWYSKSEKYPTNSNTVSVNGSEAVLAPYNETGACDTLSFDVAETNVVTIDLVNRVWISKIVVHTAVEAAGGDTPVDPQPPVSEEKTALISAPVDFSAAWNFEEVKILTTVWGGTVDPSIISEGGKLVVTYTGTENGIALALNGNGGWFQFDVPAANAADGEGWVATYTYEELVAKYGTADFSTLGAIQIAASNLPVTVTGVYWVAESNDNTGDMIGVVVALLAVSGVGITVLKKKEF